MRFTFQERWLPAAALTAAGALALAGPVPAWSQTSATPPAGQDQTSPSSPTPETGQSGQTTQPSDTSKPGESQMTQPGQMGQAGQATTPGGPRMRQKIGTQELRKHARAHVALEEKAPDVYSKLATVKDPAKELSADEKHQLREALKGTGITFQRFVREHRLIAADPQLASRLEQMEQQVKSRAGRGTQKPAGTSGAGKPKPSGAYGGQQSSGAAGGATTPDSGAAPSARPGSSPSK